MAETNPVTKKEFTDEQISEIDKGNARFGTKYRWDNKWWYFHTLPERTQFMGNPEAYIGEGGSSSTT